MFFTNFRGVVLDAVDATGSSLITGTKTPHVVRVATTTATLQPNVTIIDLYTQRLPNPIVDSYGEMIFTGVTNAPVLSAGSILIGEDSYGEPFLRKASSVVNIGSTIVVQTSQASIFDVFSSLDFYSQVTTVNVPSYATAQTIGVGAVKPLASVEARDTIVEMANGGYLHAIETPPLTTNTSAPLIGAVLPISFDAQWSSGAQIGGVNATVSYKFVPTLSFSAKTKTTLGVPTDLTLNASAVGDMKANLSLTGSISRWVSKSFQLAKKKFKLRIIAGGVPIWFEPRLSLYLDVKLAGTSSLTILKNYNRKISINVERAFGGAWTKKASNQLTKNVKFNFNGESGVEASLRAVLDFRFYGVSSVKFTPDAYVSSISVLNANIHPLKTSPTIETTTAVGYRVPIDAKLMIWKATLTSWNNNNMPLLSSEQIIYSPIQPILSFTNLGLARSEVASTVSASFPDTGTRWQTFTRPLWFGPTPFPTMTEADATLGYVDAMGYEHSQNVCTRRTGNFVPPPFHCVIQVKSPNSNGGLHYTPNIKTANLSPQSLIDGYSNSISIARIDPYCNNAIFDSFIVTDGYSQTYHATGNVFSYLAVLNSSWLPSLAIPPHYTKRRIYFSAKSKGLLGEVIVVGYDVVVNQTPWSPPTATQIVGSLMLRQGTVSSLVGEMLNGFSPIVANQWPLL